ncbi:hypothetical protein RSAG8_12440, partial [Rhizoctonia solani AG-8 WAC10335]
MPRGRRAWALWGMFTSTRTSASPAGWLAGTMAGIALISRLHLPSRGCLRDMFLGAGIIGTHCVWCWQ